MEPDPSPSILVSAGEPSGDLHGAEVVRAFRERFPAARVDAVGGPLMAAAGANILCPIEALGALGLVEIVEKIPAHVRLYYTLRRALRDQTYQLVIPIDYPGFNLRLSLAATAAGIPVLYYIAPQLWAWGPGRAKRFAKAIDHMAVILPFEEGFFNRLGLATSFVGHPLLDGDPWPSHQEARRTLAIDHDDRVLALFPGSRPQEIRAHWPLFRRASIQLLEEGLCRRVLVGATEDGMYPDPGPVEVIHGQPVRVLAAADAALAKSGTTTLQAAVAGTPMVVAYRTAALTAFVARRVMTVRWVSLVNLIAERQIVPELLQENFTERRLLEEIRPLLTPGDPAREAQLEGLSDVRSRLGQPGAADRVVELALELVPAWR
ncbi:MAG: lipid-A-disaccharide synthase [Gemmatimonadales bacterium]